jgi:hypothetical protein
MDIPRDIYRMGTASECVVVYAERVGGNVVIEFNDGKCALYSASFLHAMLAQAAELDASNSEEDIDVSGS